MNANERGYPAMRELCALCAFCGWKEVASRLAAVTANPGHRGFATKGTKGTKRALEKLCAGRPRSEMENASVLRLCDTIRQTGFEIHRYFRHGHLEKVYENALAHRLRTACLDVVQQHPLPVYDEDGTLVGNYYADLFVDHRLIIEIKAASRIARKHVAQILGYLRASRVEHGLLINFGAPHFQIRKFILNDNS